MYKLLIITIVILGLITIYLGNETLNWQKEKFEVLMAWEAQKFDVEMKKACQGFAAATNDKKWSYKSCVKELQLKKATEKTLDVL